MIHTIQFTAAELEEVASGLRVMCATPAVKKMVAAIELELGSRAYEQLPADHPARIDPDYPPNSYISEAYSETT